MRRFCLLLAVFSSIIDDILLSSRSSSEFFVHWAAVKELFLFVRLRIDDNFLRRLIWFIHEVSSLISSSRKLNLFWSPPSEESLKSHVSVESFFINVEAQRDFLVKMTTQWMKNELEGGRRPICRHDNRRKLSAWNPKMKLFYKLTDVIDICKFHNSCWDLLWNFRTKPHCSFKMKMFCVLWSEHLLTWFTRIFASFIPFLDSLLLFHLINFWKKEAKNFSFFRSHLFAPRHKQKSTFWV